VKVGEVRTAITKYSKAELQEIVVELYKRIPKGKKEEYDIDGLIAHYVINEPVKKVEPSWDLDFLLSDVDEFLENAKEGNYYAPNRIISKKDRGKWRFVVKDFVKKLSSVTGEDVPLAADALASLYHILAYACSYWTFTSDNTFPAINFKQTDFLELVLSKFFYSGYDHESVMKGLMLTLDNGVDRETFSASLGSVFVSLLKTNDTKELGIQCALEYIQNYTLLHSGERKYDTSTARYLQDERINHAVIIVFKLRLALHESDLAIDFWKKNYRESYSPEVKLYIMLSYLRQYPDLWIREYEEGARQKIKPRDSLTEEYKKLVMAKNSK
jgi:hypothetical protein